MSDSQALMREPADLEGLDPSHVLHLRAPSS